MAKSDKVEQSTPSTLDERIENLKKMFPEFFTEGKLDVPKLQELLGENVGDGAERYRFAWTGKARCDSTTSNTYTSDTHAMPRGIC